MGWISNSPTQYLPTSWTDSFYYRCLFAYHPQRISLPTCLTPSDFSSIEPEFDSTSCRGFATSHPQNYHRRAFSVVGFGSLVVALPLLLPSVTTANQRCRTFPLLFLSSSSSTMYNSSPVLSTTRYCSTCSLLSRGVEARATNHSIRAYAPDSLSTAIAGTTSQALNPRLL